MRENSQVHGAARMLSRRVGAAARRVRLPGMVAAALRASSAVNATGASRADPPQPRWERTRRELRAAPVEPPPGHAPAASVAQHVTTRIPTTHGVFDVTAFSYSGDASPKEHLALVSGDLAALAAAGPVLCRVHSECLTGEVLGSRLCDCGEQLESAMARVSAEGGGLVLYLRQEGRGIGLVEKLKAYNLQARGYDTVQANRMLGHADDARDFGVAALMLRSLGVGSIRLMTNNPLKLTQLGAHGIRVAERVPIVPVQLSEHNRPYLATKAAKMGHLLVGSVVGAPAADGGRAPGVALPSDAQRSAGAARP